MTLARTAPQRVLMRIESAGQQTLQLACGHSITEPLPGAGHVYRSCPKCPPVNADKYGR